MSCPVNSQETIRVCMGISITMGTSLTHNAALDLYFLIEIHPGDGFLEGEIRFRISRSIAKSEIRSSKSKSGFPN